MANSTVGQWPIVDQWLHQENLDVSYKQFIQNHLPQLLAEIRQAMDRKPFVVGVYGPQGSGKSTLAACLKMLLSSFGLTAVVVSIDDFYQTALERAELAKSIHPMLNTRGVPGTHDIALGLEVFNSLIAGQPTAIPKFLKAFDDRAPQAQWPMQIEPVDIIIFEGWFVGLDDCLTEAFLQHPEPLNDLEAQQDAHGHWRNYIAKSIAAYQDWFATIDWLIGFEVPSFQAVFDWRWQQELKLQSKTPNASQTKLMNQAEINLFIQHFERITAIAQANILPQAQAVLRLDNQQQLIKADYTKGLYRNKSRQSIDLSQHIKPQLPLIIATDLDGTLLGHEDYSFAGAPAIFAQFAQAGIPIIINTSKTYAEVNQWQQTLGSCDPVIVENGGAIVFSTDEYAHYMQPATQAYLKTYISAGLLVQAEGVVQLTLGRDRQSINQVLDHLVQTFDFKFQRMRDWSTAQISQITGLSLDQAAKAQVRYTAEALHWLDASQEDVELFRLALQTHGLRLVKGGRFYHVMGNQDKATALKLLVDLIVLKNNHNQINNQINNKNNNQASQPNSLAQNTALLNTQQLTHIKRPYVIALGDNHNDQGMLNQADLACVMPNQQAASGSLRNPLDVSAQPNVYYPQQAAPKGWVATMTLIATYNLERELTISREI